MQNAYLTTSWVIKKRYTSNLGQYSFRIILIRYLLMCPTATDITCQMQK